MAEPVPHCGCDDECACVCDDIFGDPVDCACIEGQWSAEEATTLFSEDALAMLPDSFLVPSEQAIAPKKRKRLLLDVNRLSTSQLPKTLEFEHHELAEKLFKDLNFVRSYFKTAHMSFQNEVTEVIRATMMARDAESYEDIEFYCELSSKLLTDSVSKLNRKIKDGLVTAVGAPQLQSKKKKKRSRGFFDEEDYNDIERAKDITTNILGLGTQKQPSRAERGSFSSRHPSEGKGKGKGGKGKGKGKGHSSTYRGHRSGKGGGGGSSHSSQPEASEE
jgi:hypothetical protein